MATTPALAVTAAIGAPLVTSAETANDAPTVAPRTGATMRTWGPDTVRSTDLVSNTNPALSSNCSSAR
ncbi:MAG: hypothetical protein AAF628_25980 [Planctomycetota bacterium]